MSERPSPSLFTFLFSPEQTQTVRKEYESALAEARRAEQEPELTPEQTVKFYGQACGVTNWSTSKDVN